MKTSRILTILSMAAVLLSFSSAAYAGPGAKPWVFSWWESHWDGLDFVPYQDGKRPHNSQWHESKWQPHHWASQRASGAEVIRDFYYADILRDQYVDDDVPVLEVGPGFYALGGQDQRRVAAMVDHVYNITGSKDFGMYHLYDWKTKDIIGSYTRYGLQLQ